MASALSNVSEPPSARTPAIPHTQRQAKPSHLRVIIVFSFPKVAILARTGAAASRCRSNPLATQAEMTSGFAGPLPTSPEGEGTAEDVVSAHVADGD